MSPGCAYTIASGKLFCSMDEFHREAERILERQVWTHEFANHQTWEALRERYEVELAGEVAAV